MLCEFTFSSALFFLTSHRCIMQERSSMLPCNGSYEVKATIRGVKLSCLLIGKWGFSSTCPQLYFFGKRNHNDSKKTFISARLEHNSLLLSPNTKISFLLWTDIRKSVNFMTCLFVCQTMM